MSQNLLPLLTQGISKQFGLSYNAWNTVIPRIAHMGDMSTRYMDRQGWEKYGLPGQRDPGMSIKQDVFQPSFGKRYTVVNYALGDTIAQEDWDDDQYGVLNRLLPAKGGALGEAFETLEEIVFANMFKNLGFASNASTGVSGSPDGYSLFNTAHPISSANPGVTVSNRPSTEVDASIAAYQAAATSLRKQKAPNNTQIIKNDPRCVVCHTDQEYIWYQILKGEWERGTADRNTNARVQQDSVDLIPWPYFDKSGSTGTNNAWFMLGKQHNVWFVRRQATKFKTDYATSVLGYVFVAYSRFVPGWDSYLGAYGSVGT